ncbi:MAG: DUF3237 domain-containing protein [Polymorphobacter sp.]
MTSLAHSHLLTFTLDVGFAEMLTIGRVPAGLRRIAPVEGGRFEGPRLRGEVLPGGADWVVNRPDGVMVIDVRLTLKAVDGALIYLTYQGRFVATPDAMTRFNTGRMLAPAEYSLAIAARFECGDERHAWLNDVIAVGTGEQTRTGPIYTIFAIGGLP